jgi:pyruvate dehydrogenase E2 component (dihydrolipoamide acetyltransferase)
MARSFRLPDLGEGIHEGEVVAVRVKVGDAVKEGDIILEIETDKATVEIPSPYTGTVVEILVKPGDLIKVADIMIIFDGGEEISAESGTFAGTPPVDAGKRVLDIPESSAKQSDAGPVPASPATRRLARELGVDLHSIVPSGPAGLVTAEDVRALAVKGSAPALLKLLQPETTETTESRPLVTTVPSLPDFSRYGAVKRIPLRSIRRATAKQMALSWSQIPHVNSQDAIYITQLETFRNKHKAAIQDKGGRLTLTVFALKAAATALKAYPNFNASLDIETGEIVLKDYFNIGVAVNTENGLIVPVIRDVDRKSLTDLAIELNETVHRTRGRKTSLENIRGGTFTITNSGAMGGGFFTPIINYPEVAILGMGQTAWQPVVIKNDNGLREIVPRLMMPVVLCIDHRILDGADAVRFLKMINSSLQDPEELLMTMI